MKLGELIEKVWFMEHVTIWDHDHSFCPILFDGKAEDLKSKFSNDEVVSIGTGNGTLNIYVGRNKDV